MFVRFGVTAMECKAQNKIGVQNKKKKKKHLNYDAESEVVILPSHWPRHKAHSIVTT